MRIYRINMKFTKNATVYLKLILTEEIKLQEYEKGYEDVLPELFKQVDFNYELVDDLFWIELDFPEDVKNLSFEKRALPKK